MRLSWKLFDEADDDGTSESSAGISEADLVADDGDAGSDGGDGRDAGPSGGTELGAATTPEPASQPDPYSYVFDAAREHGYDLSTKYKTGKEAFRGLINAQSVIGKRDQDAELGRRLKPYSREIDEFIESKLAQQQAPQADPQESPFDIPQLPPSVLRYVGRDEQGQLILGDTAPPDVRKAFDNWSRKREDFAYNLTTNPREAIVNPLREQLRQELLGEFEQRMAQREQALRAESINRQVLADVSPWLWQLDANGHRVMGYDQNGNEAPLYSEKGAQYAQAMRELQAGGMQDVAGMHRLALRMVGGPPAAPTQAPTASPSLAQGQVVPPGGRATKTRAAKPLENTAGMDLRSILVSEGWKLEED